MTSLVILLLVFEALAVGAIVLLSLKVHRKSTRSTELSRQLCEAEDKGLHLRLDLADLATSERYLSDDDDYAIFRIARASVDYERDQYVADREADARKHFLEQAQWSIAVYQTVLQQSGVDEADFLRLAPKLF